MNSDEIQNALTHVLVAMGAAWAASHGIDSATFSSLVGAAVALGAGIYSVINHWNKIKTPEGAKNG